MVNAGEIIAEIKQLTPEERAKVVAFVCAEERRDRHALTPEELVALADRMVASKDPREADDLEKQILSGFYGK